MKFGPEASGVNLEEISLITDGQFLVLALKKFFGPQIIIWIYLAFFLLTWQLRCPRTVAFTL